MWQMLKESLFSLVVRRRQMAVAAVTNVPPIESFWCQVLKILYRKMDQILLISEHGSGHTKIYFKNGTFPWHFYPLCSDTVVSANINDILANFFDALPFPNQVPATAPFTLRTIKAYLVQKNFLKICLWHDRNRSLAKKTPFKPWKSPKKFVSKRFKKINFGNWTF